jgi:hypothetical protein
MGLALQGALTGVQNAMRFVELGSSFFQIPQTKMPHSYEQGILLFGAPGEIRTPDQVVRSHLLYPAELRVHNFGVFLHCHLQCQPLNFPRRDGFAIWLSQIPHPFGAPSGRLKRYAFYRTPDQVVRSHLLYPAELRVHNFGVFLHCHLIDSLALSS